MCLPDEGTWTEWLPSNREDKISNKLRMNSDSDNKQTLFFDENSNVNEVSVNAMAVKYGA